MNNLERLKIAPGIIQILQNNKKAQTEFKCYKIERWISLNVISQQTST